jgi:hypothetical protein
MWASLIRATLAMAVGLLAVGCEKESPPTGGGEHKITGITLSTRDGAKECRVGNEVQLIVSAWWAIPSRTEVTEKAQFTVEPPEMGVVKARGVFVPARAGKATLTATYRPVEHGFNQTFKASLVQNVAD